MFIFAEPVLSPVPQPFSPKPAPALRKKNTLIRKVLFLVIDPPSALPCFVHCNSNEGPSLGLIEKDPPPKAPPRSLLQNPPFLIFPILPLFLLSPTLVFLPCLVPLLPITGLFFLPSFSFLLRLILMGFFFSFSDGRSFLPPFFFLHLCMVSHSFSMVQIQDTISFSLLQGIFSSFLSVLPYCPLAWEFHSFVGLHKLEPCVSHLSFSTLSLGFFLSFLLKTPDP